MIKAASVAIRKLNGESLFDNRTNNLQIQRYFTDPKQEHTTAGNTFHQ